MSRSWLAVLTSGLIALGATTAGAASIAHEGFAYPAGALALAINNGGSGFVLPWNGDAGVVVQGPGSLVHPLALPSSGRMIGGGFNVNRTLSSAISQSEFWMSFMIQASPGNDQVWLGLDGVPTQFPFLFFGRRLTNYFIQNGSNAAATVCCASGAGVTDLLIVRVTKGGATTSVDLWINKNPLLTLPDLSTVIPSAPTLQWVNLQVQPGFQADEVRIVSVGSPMK